MSFAANERTLEFYRLAAARASQQPMCPPPPLRVRNSALQEALDQFLSSERRVGVSQVLRVLLHQCAEEIDVARNDQARMHWCEARRTIKHWIGREQREAQRAVERHRSESEQTESDVRIQIPLRVRAVVHPTRAHELESLHRQLRSVSELYTSVCEMVQRQNVAIDGVERAVDSIATRIDATERELRDIAPRDWNSRRWRWYWDYWPRSRRQQLICCACAILAVNYVGVLLYVWRAPPNSAQ